MPKDIFGRGKGGSGVPSNEEIEREAARELERLTSRPRPPGAYDPYGGGGAGYGGGGPGISGPPSPLEQMAASLGDRRLGSRGRRGPRPAVKEDRSGFLGFNPGTISGSVGSSLNFGGGVGPGGMGKPTAPPADARPLRRRTTAGPGEDYSNEDDEDPDDDVGVTEMALRDHAERFGRDLEDMVIRSDPDEAENMREQALRQFMERQAGRPPSGPARDPGGIRVRTGPRASGLGKLRMTAPEPEDEEPVDEDFGDVDGNRDDTEVETPTHQQPARFAREDAPGPGPARDGRRAAASAAQWSFSTDERVRLADERALMAEERARAAEDRARLAEERAVYAEARAWAIEQEATEAIERAVAAQPAEEAPPAPPAKAARPAPSERRRPPAAQQRAGATAPPAKATGAVKRKKAGARATAAPVETGAEPEPEAPQPAPAPEPQQASPAARAPGAVKRKKAAASAKAAPPVQAPQREPVPTGGAAKAPGAVKRKKVGARATAAPARSPEPAADNEPRLGGVLGRRLAAQRGSDEGKRG